MRFVDLSDVFLHALLCEDTRPAPELAAKLACDYAQAFIDKLNERCKIAPVPVLDAALAEIYVHAMLCEDTRPTPEQAFDLAFAYVDALRAEQRARGDSAPKTIDGEPIDDIDPDAVANLDPGAGAETPPESTLKIEASDTDPAPPPHVDDSIELAEIKLDEGAVGAAGATPMVGATGANGA